MDLQPARVAQKFQVGLILICPLDAWPDNTPVSPPLNATQYTVGYFSASNSLHGWRKLAHQARLRCSPEDEWLRIPTLSHRQFTRRKSW